MCRSKRILSIIIVNYRSWPDLENCLQSLKPLMDRYEILVVDNFSNDGPLDSFVKNHPEIKFINSPHNLGFGGGCRLGVSHSSTDYFLFLNPDTLANEAAIDGMLRFLKKQERYGIVSCRQHKNLARHYLLFPNIRRFSSLLKSLETRIFRKRFRVQRWEEFEFIAPDWVSASVLMISRENYEKIGGWSKKLWMYYEDPDLCKRLSDLGRKAALLTNVSIYHKHGGASRRDMEVTALTKTEIAISRHVYICEHFPKAKALLAHLLIIIGFCIFGSLWALLGALFFFVPKLKLQSTLWLRRWKYYRKVMKTGSWLSPRLMNSTDVYKMASE